MTRPMTAREEAEAIEKIGQDIEALLNERLFRRMSPAAIDRWNTIQDIDKIDTIAKDIAALGDQLCRECDMGDEEEDRARDNPMHPNFRRLGV